MLYQKYGKDLSFTLLPKEGYRPYPKADQRDEWENLDKQVKKKLIQQGETHLNYEWSSLSLTEYMDSSIHNQVNKGYKRMEEKRQVLSQLVIAECVDYKGRFMDDILNGIWSICEESAWEIPANIYMYQSWPDMLCDVQRPIVDLRVGMTGSLLALSSYLLGSKLDETSILINKRIEHEIQRRIIDPVLEENFWWMGFEREMNPRMEVLHPINNWNPWCNSMVLECVLLLEKDWEKRTTIIQKIFKSLDIYLDHYPNDGGCDEGPGYWVMAPGAVLDILTMLYDATDGVIDEFQNEKIQKMSAYIYKAYVGNDRYVNFADARSTFFLPAEMVMRYGKKLQDEKMASFGADRLKNDFIKHITEDNEKIRLINRVLSGIFSYQKALPKESKDYYEKNVWYEELQVLMTRQQQGTYKGLHLAAKAGHNGESHNHNDVGQFMIHLDGKPMIIDPGVEEYRTETFSKNRYQIWTMRTDYHNLPRINGQEQKVGKRYHATHVKATVDEDHAGMEMDLTCAYPKKSDLRSFERSIEMKRTDTPCIVLKDQIQFNQSSKELILHLMTWPKPQKTEKGILLDENFLIIYPEEDFDFTYECVPIEDEWLKQSWNKAVYRLAFTAKKKQKSHQYQFTFKEV